MSRCRDVGRPPFLQPGVIIMRSLQVSQRVRLQEMVLPHQATNRLSRNDNLDLATVR